VAWSLLLESKIRLFSYFLRSLILKPIIDCFPFYQQSIWRFWFSVVITSSLPFANSKSKWAKNPVLKFGCFGCRLRAWSKWESTCRFSTCVVRSVKGSSWSTNKGYKEVIFLSACSSRWVKEKKILGFKTVPSGPLICFSWQFKALLHIFVPRYRLYRCSLSRP